MRRFIFVTTLILSLAIVTSAAAAPGILDGFTGLIIWLFLGYCGIIVIAQLVAALVGLRRTLEELSAGKVPSRRMPLR